MPKIPKTLEEYRKNLICGIWEKNTENLTVEDIGKIFGLTTSSVYNILKEAKINNG